MALYPAPHDESSTAPVRDRASDAERCRSTEFTQFSRRRVHPHWKQQHQRSDGMKPSVGSPHETDTTVVTGNRHVVIKDSTVMHRNSVAG